MKNINTCIFDLDGVIVDTAKYHFEAWRRLAGELGIDFTEADNEQLKGISRMDSLDLILKLGNVDKSASEKQELASRKNQWYLDYIESMDASEILPGVLPLLEELKAKAIHIVLGSSSKNARKTLEQVGLSVYFDAIVDGTSISRSKPDPQVFQLGAQAVGVDPEQCIVFEDAAGGITAAKSAGMYAIGIGEAEVLGDADLVFSDLDGKSFSDILQQLMAHITS